MTIKRLFVAILALLVLGCGDSDSFVFDRLNQGPPVATSLRFATFPTTAASGTALNPTISVEVLDQFGQRFPSTQAITLALAATPVPPAGSVLNGTLTQNAVAGVATFADVNFSLGGTYAVTATATGLTPATSNQLTVTTTFRAAPGSPISGSGISGPIGIVAADFDGQNRDDLAIGNLNGNTVTLLLNNGSASFAAAANSPFAVDTQPVDLAVGDFNGATGPDLVVGHQSGNSTRVLTNNGAGANVNFTTQTLNSGTFGSQVVVGNFDNVAGLDIATAAVSDARLRVYLNNGTGTFPANGVEFVSQVAFGLGAGDFDGANNDDIALAVNGVNLDTVQAFLFTGAGPTNAGPAATFGDLSSREVQVADLDGQNRDDFIFGDGVNNNFTVFLNDGTGTNFVQGQTVTGAGGVNGITLADLDGANGPDVIATAGDSVFIHFNNGNGTFTAGPVLNVTRAQYTAVSDFDGNGRPDIAATSFDGNSVFIFLQL